MLRTGGIRKKKEVECFYSYEDLNGNVVHQTVRYKNPKDFGQRRPDGKGGHIYKGVFDGITPILYELRQLCAADPSLPVFVVEGEKDVQRLLQLGLVATTNPMGAEKWHRVDSTPLNGRHCVVIGDNDDAGRKHANQVAMERHGKAASIKVLELPGLPNKGDVSDFLNAGGTVDQLRDLADATPEWTPFEHRVLTIVRPEPPNNGSRVKPLARRVNQDDDKRIEVEISTDRHLAIEPTIKALAADPDLYRRGDTLGTVTEEEGESITLAGGIELNRARGVSRFLPLSESALGCVLTRNAKFYQWKQDKSGEPIAVDCHPPSWLISAAATWGQWPGIRSLQSIASSPWVRPDGSIPRPGFDPATGTLYRPSVILDSIPENPTQADARQAAFRLYSPIRQFPFASASDWTVWIAGLLTAVQRPAIEGPVPGFAFNGNRAGTGKGLLVDSIGLIAWGSGIPTRSYPLDPAEAGKTKLSLGLSGLAAVHFDNLPEGGFYGGSEIDSALTSLTCEGRILGASRESGPVPIRPCWFLTGNNLSPWKDAYRRWLPCNLETKLESPHERDDVEEVNLRQYIRQHRADLLRDALVILRAHALAGSPKCGTTTLGSFEEWDSVVRGAVWFATGNDCLATQRKASSDSPDRLEKLSLVEGWAQLPDGEDKGLTAADARAIVEGSPTVHPTLYAMFLAMSKDHKLASSSKIGAKIRAMKGQNHGGRRFEKAGEDRGSVLWRSVEIARG